MNVQAGRVAPIPGQLLFQTTSLHPGHRTAHRYLFLGLPHSLGGIVHLDRHGVCCGPCEQRCSILHLDSMGTVYPLLLMCPQSVPNLSANRPHQGCARIPGPSGSLALSRCPVILHGQLATRQEASSHYTDENTEAPSREIIGLGSNIVMRGTWPRMWEPTFSPPVLYWAWKRP